MPTKDHVSICKTYGYRKIQRLVIARCHFARNLKRTDRIDLHTAKKKAGKLLTLLVMTDGSSEPKTYKIKVLHVKMAVAGVFSLCFVVVGLLVYIYLHANKILQYADLKKHYDLVVEDNKRIQSLEMDYRKIKQENQKIRMVFGMVGMAKADSTTEGLGNLGQLGQFRENPTDLLPTGLNEHSNNFLSDRILPTLIPVESKFVTRAFNAQSTSEADVHLGIDIAAAVGTPIRSAGDGWVLFADWLPDFGYTIIVHHGSGFVSVYKHAHVLLCNQGNLVRKGDVIATVGKTGTMTTGAHLHFEIWRDGVAIDPANYVPELNEFMDDRASKSKTKTS